MTTDVDSDNISLDEVIARLAEYTWGRKWDNVKRLYNEFPDQAHTAIISESGATALHVAIDLNEEYVVLELVNAILTHNNFDGQQEDDQKVKALETKNERGDTPLHFAASRGFAKICKCIIGDNNERIFLLSLKNEHGETPLFQAAINWRKQAFAYLAHISKGIVTLQHLVRDDGDSILHTAIKGEHFDLAVIIAHYYDFLSTHRNKEGSTPLKVLATRPSAFKSSSNLSWYKRILYHCILVEPLDPAKTIRSNLIKMVEACPDSNKMKFPDNYTTLYDFFSIFGKFLMKINEQDPEDPSNDRSQSKLMKEEKPIDRSQSKFLKFVKSAYVHALGFSGVELKDVKTAKKKHVWSSQILKALMERPYAAFTGEGGQPTDTKIDSDMYNIGLSNMRNIVHVKTTTKSGGTNRLKEEQESKLNAATDPRIFPCLNITKETTKAPNEIKTEYEMEVDKKETPFLVAAKNGKVEMVNEILDKMPWVIYDTNSRKENVLLVAVKCKQFLVVETLRMRIYADSEPELWNILIHAKDDRQNTILHLAAEATGGNKPGQNIAGSALQMMWDIKWFQYIKSLVPEYYYFIGNKYGNAAGEIFKNAHENLIKDSNEWLKNTSESCSVVAVLIAGASFTTASAVPGGTTEGKPILEDNPAFNAFAFASLGGLCFSVGALIMFLSILTSQKQVKDFRRDLPLKLYIGLSSLFMSLASMFVSFCTGHFFLLSHRFKWILFPIYAATCMPVAFYGVAQFPLYIHLLTTIFAKLPRPIDNSDNF